MFCTGISAFSVIPLVSLFAPGSLSDNQGYRINSLHFFNGIIFGALHFFNGISAAKLHFFNGINKQMQHFSTECVRNGIAVLLV